MHDFKMRNKGGYPCYYNCYITLGKSYIIQHRALLYN